jgi:hypothetical protein
VLAFSLRPWLRVRTGAIGAHLGENRGGTGKPAACGGLQPSWNMRSEQHLARMAKEGDWLVGLRLDCSGLGQHYSEWADPANGRLLQYFKASPIFKLVQICKI